MSIFQKVTKVYGDNESHCLLVRTKERKSVDLQPDETFRRKEQPVVRRETVLDEAIKE